MRESGMALAAATHWFPEFFGSAQDHASDIFSNSMSRLAANLRSEKKKRDFFRTEGTELELSSTILPRVQKQNTCMHV